MTSESTDGRSQSMLAWIYSFILGVCAFGFSFHLAPLLFGLPSVVISFAGAIICARIAGWMATLDGRSNYGVLAGFIFVLILPLWLTLMTDLFALAKGARVTIAAYMSLFIPLYVVTLMKAAPVAVVVTLVFNLALAVARMMRWVNVQQRWI
jgi:hypothetical protein